MNYARLKSIALYFLSGILVAYTVLYAVFLLSWICYVPFFYLLKKEKDKKQFATSLVFGLGVSVVSFFWMLGASKEFSGNNIGYAVFITALSTLCFSLYWSLLIGFVRVVSLKTEASKYLNASAIAACFVLAESVLNSCFSEAPYYLYNSGYGLLNNLYAIQWASYLGLPFLSLVVIFTSVLIADLLITKNWKQLISPVMLILVFFAGGASILWNVKEQTRGGKAVKVAILAENVPPGLHWDASGGNILAERLLTLNRTAQALNPDIALWSECAVPWPYNAEDDLLKEILKTSKNTTHLIGYNSEYSKDKVFNSVYGLTATGKILGRYDKRYLLSFIETPTFGFSVPFYDLAGSFIQPGTSSKPILTSLGKAGVVICNEVVNPQATISAVKSGADFLFNLSNDGWFKDSYIVDLHFLYGRLAAVINRRDMVMNSNSGISGCIDASGEIKMKRRSKEMFVQTVNISTINFDNSKYYFPSFVVFLSGIVVVFSLFKGYYKQ